MPRRRFVAVLTVSVSVTWGCMAAPPTETTTSPAAAGAALVTTSFSSPAASALVAASPGTGETPYLIDGLLTEPDGNGLVASYIGGECDGPARLAVAETVTRIDVEVLVGPSPEAEEVCSAVGFSRSVAARLAQPVDDRPIYSNDRRLVPFDGSRRLFPSALPPDFIKGNEESMSTPPSDSAAPSSGSPTSAEGVDVTTQWTVAYAQPQTETDNRCTPTRGSVAVNVGPTNLNDSSTGWTLIDSASIDGHPAQLWREGSADAPRGWAYAWTADQGSVEVLALGNCEGDRVLSPTELLPIAQSLKSD